MARELVFIHGRAQEAKDASALKQEWLDALDVGLKKSGLALPIDESDVRFPYYGDTLFEMTWGKDVDEAAEVILKGPATNAEAKRFMASVLDEIRIHFGVTDEQILAAYDAAVIDKRPENWPWVRAILQALDSSSESISAATIALITYDVYRYMDSGVIRRKVEDGVKKALKPGGESVVVAHSLGSIVAYVLLHRAGSVERWDVPQLITVGAPLAVRAIREALPSLTDKGGLTTPSCVGGWFNALDSRDAVSLYPLNAKHFPLRPSDQRITNKTDVKNRTKNRHGISGYLDDVEVAMRIYEALTAAPH